MIFSDLPSSAEAGFAKAGNQCPLFGIMFSRVVTLDLFAARRHEQFGGV
jgi:hypothetical protein